jgi:predicted RNase H-like HicB family nuclease
MKPIRNDHYTYRVTWSEDDEEHVGLCAEFPSLSWLAASPEVALRGIRNAVGDVVADMKKSGEPIPEPLSTHDFSGKFSVRVPPNVHRELALEAAEAGVSLNRLVTVKLVHTR